LKSVCVVMRDLSVDYNKHRRLEDIAYKSSDATLNRAWDVVLAQTQTVLPAWVSDKVKQVVYGRLYQVQSRNRGSSCCVRGLGDD